MYLSQDQVSCAMILLILQEIERKAAANTFYGRGNKVN